MTVSSDKTKLRVPAFAQQIQTTNALRVRVPGMLLGGTIEVTTRIVLNRTIAKPGPSEAKDAGSILYEDFRPVRIEGVGPQMPSAVVSFKEHGWPTIAKWTVGHTRVENLTEDAFHEPVVEHLQLWLNSDAPDFASLFEDLASDFALRMVARDIAHAVTKMGSSSEFSVEREYPSGSLGEQIVRISNRIGMPPDVFASKDPSDQGAYLMKAVFSD